MFLLCWNCWYACPTSVLVLSSLSAPSAAMGSDLRNRYLEDVANGDVEGWTTAKSFHSGHEICTSHFSRQGFEGDMVFKD